MTLRERVEREMHAKEDLTSCDHLYLSGELCTLCAVDVALRLLSKEREKANAAEKALVEAFNWWQEPSCQSEDCDKGYHVEQWRAYQRTAALVARYAQPGGEEGK